MVKIPRTVQKVLENYVLKIDKQIPVKKAILFGSYAKGTYNKLYSPLIDLEKILVSW